MNESSREKLDMDSSSVRPADTSSSPRPRSAHCNFSRTKYAFLVPKWFAYLVIATIALTFATICLLSVLSIKKRSPCPHAPGEDLLLDPNKLNSSEPVARKEPFASRLPTSLVPVSYDVSLQPFILDPLFYFDGNVTILVYCNESTSNITLHFNDLTILNDTLKISAEESSTLESSSSPSSRVELEAESFHHDFEQQLYTIVLGHGQSLESGHSYRMTVRFRGNLNDDLAGFYRSAYNDTTTGRQRWLAVTQFQPTDARRAFPCFDEPALKATFNITLIHWKNMTALSNMPLRVRVDRGDDWVADHFETTVKMSTYLLAFVVGKLSFVEDKEAKPVFRVWSRPGNEKASEKALFMGPKMLTHYEKFFNISFPLPKTDMVAVPDFNAGAMENWGLIVYRETALLYDPDVASASNLQRVATVVAHELAHQWFGNLVTPKWWDDLWLNEGFASYMEYEGVDSVFPNWKMHEQFVVDEVQDVFELDCLTSSHPISVKVNHPDEINEIFDRISYGKGSSIIRMMNFLLGPKTFQLGVSNYLKAMKFGSAEQDDLWSCLTSAQDAKIDVRLEDVNVKRVMDSWTLQDGYPVVTLTRDYAGQTARIRQKRFLLTQLDDTNATTNKSDYLWEIPVTFIAQSSAQLEAWQPSTKLWMHKDREVAIPQRGVPPADQWMILNVQQVGYYRVNYDPENWRLLTKQLQENHLAIHVTNRAQILDDAQDLARAGLISYAVPLEICRYLSAENDHIPWNAATDGFSFLDRMLRRSALYGKWKEFVLSLIRPLYDRVGWRIINDDDILRQYTQETALTWACKYGHGHCIDQARGLFADWKRSILSKQKNPIDPNFRSFVYCYAIAHGNQTDWDFTWTEYLRARDVSEKDKLMRALACSREPWLLRRYISWAFDENSKIRRQDGSYVFRAVAANNYGRDIAYGFLRENWDVIVKYYGKSFFSFGSLVKSASGSFTTDFDVLQLKEFYARVKNNVGTAQRSFLQAIEQAEANAYWTNKHYQKIEHWLTDWKSKHLN